MLRHRLQNTPSILQDFEIAAEDKYWQGTELAADGHRSGGIYLLGYSAEMTLKFASFRMERHPLTTPSSGLFGPVRKWMKTRYGSVDYEAYHSLLFWMYYLRGKRRELGMALPAALDYQLVRRMRRLHSIWLVEIRYRPDIASVADVAVMYDEVTWLRENRVQLWS